MTEKGRVVIYPWGNFCWLPGKWKNHGPISIYRFLYYYGLVTLWEEMPELFYFLPCHSFLLFGNITKKTQKVVLLWLFGLLGLKWLSGKEPACQCRRHRRWVRSQGRVDPLEKKMATHSGFLAWRIPWTEEPGGLQSRGLQRIRHDWVTKHAHIFQLLPTDHLSPAFWLCFCSILWTGPNITTFLSIMLPLTRPRGTVRAWPNTK